MATITKEITTLSDGNSSNGTLRLTFEYSQDILSNTSTVKLTLIEFKSSSKTGTYVGEGVIKVGGETQVTYTNSGSADEKCVCSSLNSYATIGSSLDNPSVVIHHGTDGNGSIPVYIGPYTPTGHSDFNLYNISQSGGNAHISAGTVYVTLPKIDDTGAVATPISPVNTVEDGSAPIKFEWALSNDSGIAPTKTDIQTSADGSTWTNLATVTSGGTSYEAEFEAGTVYWRVRAYNRDNVAGSWSSPVNFIVVAAPSAPTVLCDGSPFATITWRVNGQQAYRITVDGKVYGPFFGSAKSYTLQDYLADGEHTVTVEIQGGYGMWSGAGSVTFTVSNVAGDAVTLDAEFDIDAHLTWETTSAVEDFLIYRDGVQIGHTDKYLFTDRLALGEHEYTVVNRLADGNYTKSNAIEGVMCTPYVAMAELAGGDWIYLPLSDESDSQQGFSKSRTYVLRHFTGAEYPVLEVGTYTDADGSYTCAFKCPKQAEPFLNLFGKAVIVKSKGGNVVVGPFMQFDKKQYDLYVGYSFSIPAMHHEVYVDAAD